MDLIEERPGEQPDPASVVSIDGVLIRPNQDDILLMMTIVRMKILRMEIPRLHSSKLIYCALSRFQA